ncbi:MAG TPA: hypothetical protein VJO52_15205 [Gemmatimonadaceae bacterium]|nr:hypothetical protein [Gemmatimonadaceae bacterium]
MQQGTNTQTPDAAALRNQIRDQVRAQVEAAREQARLARNQARQAAQQAEHAGQAPPPPPPIELPGGIEIPQAPTTGTSVPPFIFDPGMGARVEHIAIEFFVAIVAIFFVVPIARAFARRIDKKPVATPLDRSLGEQLQRIENSVDSMAIEIERISEAQRYMARLQSDRSASPALPSQQAASR